MSRDRPATGVLLFIDQGSSDPPPGLAAHTITLHAAAYTGEVSEAQVEFGLFEHYRTLASGTAAGELPALVTAGIALTSAGVRCRRVTAGADASAPAVPLELQTAGIGGLAPRTFLVCEIGDCHMQKLKHKFSRKQKKIHIEQGIVSD